jgi:hypothetical protein
MTNIRTATRPNNIGGIRLDFTQPEFDNFIFDKGYDIIWYEAVRCPCNKGREGHLSNCNNCLGLGWVFINPIETKALITSINRDTKYKYWSQELSGTVNLTLRNEERLSVMDKIVLKNKTSLMSELRDVREIEDQKFIFTTYPIDSVLALFIFNGSTNSLIRVSPDDYSKSEDSDYVLNINKETYPTGFNDVVSIKYKHKIQYNVIDLPHDLRYSTELNKKGQEIELPLPIQAIAKKSEFLNGDSVNYDGTGIIDNSFL